GMLLDRTGGGVCPQIVGRVSGVLTLTVEIALAVLAELGFEGKVVLGIGLQVRPSDDGGIRLRDVLGGIHRIGHDAPLMPTTLRARSVTRTGVDTARSPR